MPLVWRQNPALVAEPSQYDLPRQKTKARHQHLEPRAAGNHTPPTRERAFSDATIRAQVRGTPWRLSPQPQEDMPHAYVRIMHTLSARACSASELTRPSLISWRILRKNGSFCLNTCESERERENSNRRRPRRRHDWRSLWQERTSKKKHSRRLPRTIEPILFVAGDINKRTPCEIKLQTNQSD